MSETWSLKYLQVVSYFFLFFPAKELLTLIREALSYYSGVQIIPRQPPIERGRIQIMLLQWEVPASRLEEVENPRHDWRSHIQRSNCVVMMSSFLIHWNSVCVAAGVGFTGYNRKGGTSSLGYDHDPTHLDQLPCYPNSEIYNPSDPLLGVL